MMEFAELAWFAWKNITHRQMRSWLTILGIVIGIGSIVLLISLAQGLDKGIKDQLGKLGSNYLIILPGNLKSAGLSFGPTALRGILYKRDVDLVRRTAGVDSVSGSLQYSNILVRFKRSNTSLTVAGVNADTYNKFITQGYDGGKFFQQGDTSSVVIGNDVANTYFAEKIYVGNQLYINNKPFRVSGIITKVGQSGGANLDSAVIIDENAARDLFPGVISSDRVSAIFALTTPEADPQDVSVQVEQELANAHKVKLDNEDFTILNAASILDQVGQITGLLTLFLGAVAAISLIVGSIGIANSMFTSVLERTRDIGILKSVGAPNGTILQMFLFESVLISAAGGIVGIVFGALAAFALNALGVTTVVSPEVVLGSLLVSVVVGGVSGYFPAYQASKLPAVVALRRE